MVLAVLLLQQAASITAPLSTAVAIIGTLATLLLGSGAVGFYLKYNTRLTVVERELQALISANLNVRVTTLETNIRDIRDGIQKLAKLDSLETKIDIFLGEIRDLKGSIVPRAEHEGRLRAIDERMNRMEQGSR